MFFKVKIRKGFFKVCPKVDKIYLFLAKKGFFPKFCPKVENNLFFPEWKKPPWGKTSNPVTYNRCVVEYICPFPAILLTHNRCVVEIYVHSLSYYSPTIGVWW